jgi:pilus assembly protein Flp/PilA
MIPLLAMLLTERKAATAVEYGLILALVVLAVMVAIIGLGGATQQTWGNILSKVEAAGPR